MQRSLTLYLRCSAILLLPLLSGALWGEGGLAAASFQISSDKVDKTGTKNMIVRGTKIGSSRDVDTGSHITMFLTGDVMLGRGIDQILPYQSDPVLYEPYMRDARGYLDLAELAYGPIPHPTDCSYIWGDALAELERVAPDLRIINLETSITTSSDYWRGKGINYRMHPDNTACLTTAKIDYCALANNHVLDWGYAGLEETLDALKKLKIQHGGAGRDLREAETPAIMPVNDKGRVLVFSHGHWTSGIPASWAAGEGKPGVNYLADLAPQTVQHINAKVGTVKQQGDIVVFSVHWGGNWGYDVPADQREFAHQLIDEADVDVVYGHSSHHVKGIEVYKEKLILYGSGDFLNDYEGIGGYEEFRGDLALMYFATVDPLTGNLVRLQMTPTRTRHFKVNRASKTDTQWLKNILNREGRRFGTQLGLGRDQVLTLIWQ